MSERSPVRISAFTFLRDPGRLGYPFLESIRSALPLVDEFVIALGSGTDDSRKALVALNDPKIRIVDTVWNEQMRDKGFVYAQQKMIAHYNCTGDWALYLEGDEVLHEQDLPRIRAALEHHRDDASVEACAFRYHHFFGSPHWLATGPGWYRSEVRLVRNTVRMFAPDGLFFVVMDRPRRMRYPRALVLEARIYHYGWVRPAQAMRDKARTVGKYWNKQEDFDRYRIDPQRLRRFQGVHPEAVQRWLSSQAAQDFEPDAGHRPSQRERRHRGKALLERWLGRPLDRLHYQPVRSPHSSPLNRSDL